MYQYGLMFLFFNISKILSYELIDNFIYCQNNCSIVKKINIIENVDICTEDVYVSFLHNDVIKFGYLTKNLTIIEQSNEVNCTEEEKTIEKENNFEIKRLNHFIGIDFKQNSSLALEQYLNLTRNFLMGFIDDKNDYVFLIIINFLVLITFLTKRKVSARIHNNDRLDLKFPEQFFQSELAPMDEENLIEKKRKQIEKSF